MEEKIVKKTIWHEMEGPFIGGREHYQEKSYGFQSKWEPFTRSEDAPKPELEGSEDIDEQNKGA
ncbi:MAG TPA: hypothetical protein VMJ66_13145 [Geobacteraceae bacterium]|nr:hypothetical protein [Geobacteraceae bacterium]